MVDIASLAIQIDTSDVARAERDLDKLSSKGAKSERAAKGVGDAHDKANGKVGAMAAASRKTSAALEQGARSAGNYAGKITAMAAPLLSVAAAMAAIGKVSSVQRQFDTLNAGLITATGSAEKAKVAFAALEEFAKQTPYDLAQAVEGFTKLVNLGLTPSEKALRSYGNTASAMGKDLNQMIEAVADAATGEFERLKEFGIKAKQNGDQVSLTFQGVTKKIGNNAAEIERYLTDLGENQFAGAMAQRMATLDGAISNLGDSWDALSRNISEAGAGDLMEAAVRQATEALDELNAQLASGQIQGQLGAIADKFDGWGGDISQTLDVVGDIFDSATGRWGALIDNNVANMTATFANFPENVRAFIQLMTVEVLSGFDKVSAYAVSFKDGIKAIFTDDTFEGVAARLEADLQRINGVRQDSIADILEERQAALDSYEAQMTAADQLRIAYEKRQAAEASANEDRLAKFKALGSSAGEAGSAVDELGKKLKNLDATGPGDAIEDYIKQFEKLHDELNPAEVAAREYGKQQDLLSDIIARGGENAGKAAIDLELLRKKYEENTQETSQWAEWTESALERVDGAFADAWRNIGDGFSSFADSLKNAFRQMLAELAHMAITRPIVMQIGAALGIGGGGSGGILSSLGGGGGGGGFSFGNLLQYAQTGYSLMTGVGPAALAGYQSGGLMGGLQGVGSYYGNLASSAIGTVSGWFGGGSAAAGAGAAAGSAGAGAGVGFGLGQPVVAGQVGGAAYAGGATAGATLGGMNLAALATPAAVVAAVYAAFEAYKAQKAGYRPEADIYKEDREFSSILAAGGTKIGSKALNATLYQIAKVNEEIQRVTKQIFGDGFLGRVMSTGSTLVGMGLEGLFGGGWQLKSSGIAVRAREGEFDGQNFQYFKRDGGLLGKSGKKYEYSEMDATLEKALSKRFESVTDGASELFEKLGFDVAESALDALDVKRKHIRTDTKKAQEKVQERLDAWFGKVGDTAVSTINKQLSAGLEGYTFEALSGLVTKLETVNATFETLNVGIYESSVAGAKLAEDMVALAGGLDAFTASTAAYYDKFFTAGEKAEDAVQAVIAQFAAMDQALPATRQQYRELVESIDVSTEAGRELVNTLMSLASAADSAYTALDALRAGNQAMVDAARANVIAAYQREGSALQATISKFDAFSRSLGAFREQLGLTILATQSPTTQIEALRKQFQATATRAKLGDESAMGDLPTVGANLANASLAFAASREDYIRELAGIQSATYDAEQTAGRQSSIAQKQLDALTDQLDALGLINNSVQTLAEAVAALAEAQTAAKTAEMTFFVDSIMKGFEALKPTQVVSALGMGFEALDANVDSLLDQAELKEALKGKASDEQLKALGFVVDTNFDGLISATEMAAAASMTQAQAITSGLAGIQQAIGSAISLAQAQAGLGSIAAGGAISGQFAGLDLDKDGTLSAGEIAGTAPTPAPAPAPSFSGLSSIVNYLQAAGERVTVNTSPKKLAELASEIAGQKVSLTVAGKQYATGGYTGPGKKYDPAGIVHAGEVVWSQDDLRRWGGWQAVDAMRQKGPELEVTGPSRIYSASQTAAMLGGGGDAAKEVRALRGDFAGMMDSLRSVAKHTMQTAKRVEYLERWDADGIPDTAYDSKVLAL